MGGAKGKAKELQVGKELQVRGKDMIKSYR
jgi:hypothetical protein